MHAVFMLYGKYEFVNILIRDICSQKLTLRIYKEGEQDKSSLIECQLRKLPFGLYEFIFPKEHKDIVLNTLWFERDGIDYDLNREISLLGLKIKPMKFLKKFLKIEDAPKIEDKTKILPWVIQHVGIIPIGVRYDGEIAEIQGELKGWKHERI